MHIIIKNKKGISESLPAGKYYICRTAAQDARNKVSRQNRQEYDNEKRALELANKMPCGADAAKAVAIAKMMNMSESHVKKILDGKKKTKVVLDGKID